MVYKIAIIILLLCSNISYSNIIYDKNKILITQLELNNYIELYKNSYNKDLEKKIALKDIVLMKKTINFLLKNNPKYISNLDNIIRSKINNFDDNNFIKDFLRFQKIKNEFISEYFRDDFKLEHLELIFTSLDQLRLPISNNNCLTIDKLLELKNDDYFLKSFYKNFKENKNDYKVKIENQLFDVCINNKQLKEIERLIINFVEKETEGKFKKFIYGNLF